MFGGTEDIILGQKIHIKRKSDRGTLPLHLLHQGIVGSAGKHGLRNSRKEALEYNAVVIMDVVDYREVDKHLRISAAFFGYFCKQVRIRRAFCCFLRSVDVI